MKKQLVLTATFLLPCLPAPAEQGQEPFPEPPAATGAELPPPAPARVKEVELRRSSTFMQRKLFFVGCQRGEDSQAFTEALPQACFLIRSKGKECRLPAQLRPTTHAEALENWGDFCQASNLPHGLNAASAAVRDRMKAELEADPQKTVSGTYTAELPGIEAHETLELVLPGLGAWSADKGAYEDKSVRFRLPNYYPSFYEPEMTALGHFKLGLSSASCPMAAEALEAALANTPAFISPSNRPDTWYPLPYKGGGVWEGSFPDATGTTTLRLDREATEASAMVLELRDGRRVKGYRRIALTADTDGERVYLDVPIGPPSVYGHAAPKPSATHARHVMIPASKPYVVSSLRAHGLREGGRRELLYRCGWLQSLQARVRRVACTGAAPVQLLERYEKEYLSTDQRPEAHWQNGMRERGEAIPQASIMDTATLEGELRECPLPMPRRGEQGEFDPTALFTAQAPQGMYVVELIGVPDDPRREGKRCIAQSVLQVTDLGLVWRQTKQGALLAYAYGLSDSAPLAEGRLRLMDAEGRTLAEYAVADGLAQGAFVEGTAYLQLLSGEDACTVPLKDEPAGSRWAPAPPTVPHSQGFFFTDRELYRWGETVHVGGIVRQRERGKLCLPRQAEARLEFDGGSLPVRFDDNGCFTAELPLPKGADGGFRLALQEGGQAIYLRHDSFSVSPGTTPSLTLEGNYSVKDEQVSATLTAHRPDGTPLAHASAELSFHWVPVNFFPRGFENYRFGDFRLVPHTQAGYKAGPAQWKSITRQLDQDGSCRIDFTLPQKGGYARPMKVDFYANVRCGDGPAVAQHKELVMLDRSSLYIGLRRASQLTQAGEDIELDLLLVGADEKRYEGAPVEVELCCTREEIRPCRYGEKLMSSTASEEVYRERLAVPAEGCRVTLPTEKLGQYIISAQGKDAEGRAFATVIRQYVWDGSPHAPWMRNDDDSLELMPDKGLYRAGDTARVLVATELEGEAHVVVSSRAGSRAWHSPVSAGQRFIEVPLTEADGPGATLDLTLVQGAGPRPSSGLPLVQSGRCELHLERRAGLLTVELPEPADSLKPGESIEVEGFVRDASGQPVAGATVFLYAVDTGIATRRRYWVQPDVAVKEQGTGAAALAFMDASGEPELQRPQDYFHPRRYASATLHRSRLIGDELANWQFHNKGVFVGGSGSSRGEGHEVPPALPCALWQKLTTDGEGRFCATFTAPARHTGYRLMAVACSGAELFGSAAVTLPCGGDADEAGALPADEEI